MNNSNSYVQWKFADFFDPRQAAMLTVGINPYDDDTLDGRFLPVLEAMRKAHYRAASVLLEKFMEGPGGTVQRHPNAPAGFPRDCLPSALFEHYDGSDEGDILFGFDGFCGLIDTHASIFEGRQFSDRAIARWLSANNYPSQFDFLRREPTSSAPEQSPAPLEQATPDYRAQYSRVANDASKRHQFLTDLKAKFGTNEKVANAIGLTRQTVDKHLRQAVSADQHKHDAFGRIHRIGR